MKHIYLFFSVIFLLIGFMSNVHGQSHCSVMELTGDMVDRSAKTLGTVKAGAYGFTLTCQRPQVMQALKNKACTLGANAIVITKEKRPGSMRSCFTITATALRIEQNNPEQGVDIDDLKRLAGSGDPDSQFVLGQHYLSGQGVSKDILEAYAWLNLAASQNLSQAVAERDKIEKQLSWEERAEAQQRSADIWLTYYKMFGYTGMNQ
jgi:uncharacterized protein YbjQ (UPF0145 family)